jgi:phage-related protein
VKEVDGIVIRDIVIAFGYEVDKASEKKANDSINALKSTASKLLGAIGIVLSIKGLASLAEAAANVEALESQFSQVFGDIEDQASTTLRNIADNTGVAVNRMKGSFTQIAAFAKASGMDTEAALSLSDRAIQAVADSAAFYDRSLEDVTASLQSFLKGNFANDAALGLSATETTRNTAANALYGKSFNQLAEDQKQLTLLKMVEDANALSGALGQAARESDTWGNQLGNLKQGLTDLKATVGGSFLKPAIQVLKLVASLVSTLSDGIKNLTGEGRSLNRMFDRMANRINWVRELIERFVKRIGGAEQAVKLLTIAAGSLMAVLAAQKIMSMVNAIRAIDKAMLGVKLKMMAIIAVVAVIALLIEDFINFMQGNNSVIGELFKKAGIDAGAARDAILKAWGAIKDFLNKNGEKIKTTLIAAWETIKAALSAAWEFISALAETVFGTLKVFWDKWGNDIIYLFRSAWNFIVNSLGNSFDAITAIFRIFAALFKGDWDEVWNGVKDFFAVVWEQVKNIFRMAVDLVLGILAFLFGTSIEDVKNWFDSVVDWFTQAADFIKGIVDKIVEFFQPFLDVIKTVTDFVGSGLQKAADFIGGLFGGEEKSVPGYAGGTGRSADTFIAGEEGPELVTGARGRKVFTNAETGNIFQTLKDIAALGMTPRPETVAASTSSVENKSVIQNNQFTNQFYGDRAGQEKSAAAMDKAADDATGVLSRGLAYVR